MFQNARNFSIQGGTFTVEQNEKTGLQLLHQKANHGAAHDSAERFPPPRCHPETRKAIVGEIMDWIEDVSRTSSVLWLNGPAGVGKTAIAQTVCERCKDSGRLGGNFFFSRTVHGRDSPRNLFSTIAYQLSVAIPEISGRIERAITNDPSILDKAIELQLQTLILEPLQVLDLSTPPTVILIDGLDECEGESTQCHILQLLSSLFEHGIIPICFIISSRPEPWIRDEFNSGLLYLNTHCISLEQSEDANEDIRTFFRGGFSDIHNSPKHRRMMVNVSRSWPSDDVIDDLVERASGQFIYPATVLKFVGDPHYRPTDRLNIIISIPTVTTPTSSPFADLDRLYSQILSACADKPQTLSVLGTIIAMRDAGRNLDIHRRHARYSLDVAEKLLGLQAGDGYLALRSIHSLVNVAESLNHGNDGPVRYPYAIANSGPDAVIFYHKSFLDFLLDAVRSGEYYIDMQSINNRIALGCLEAMRTLSLSLATRINCIALGYAMTHWTEHCTSSGEPQEPLVLALKNFDMYTCYLPTWQLQDYWSGGVGRKKCLRALSRWAFRTESQFQWLPKLFQKRRRKSLDATFPDPDTQHAITFVIDMVLPNGPRCRFLRTCAQRLNKVAEWLEKGSHPPKKLIRQYRLVCDIVRHYDGYRKASLKRFILV